MFFRKGQSGRKAVKMRKKKDAALDYMLKLGIFPAKTPSGALEQLRTVMDPETLKEVLAQNNFVELVMRPAATAEAE